MPDDSLTILFEDDYRYGVFSAQHRLDIAVMLSGILR